MHDCDLCGQACDCDMEDHYQSQPADCTHICDDENDDEDEDDYADYERETDFYRVIKSASTTT